MASRLQRGELFFEGKTKLLNDGVRKNLARDAFYFRFCFLLGKTAVQGNFEILPLPDFLQTFVADLGQGSVDGFALRIEDALFQRNKNLRFHGHENYTAGVGNRVSGSAYGGYPNGLFT
jgi:hypothetical protein